MANRWPRPMVGSWISCTEEASAIPSLRRVPACVLTGALQRHRHRPIIQQRPTGAGSNSSARRPGAEWPLRFPGHAPL